MERARILVLQAIFVFGILALSQTVDAAGGYYKVPFQGNIYGININYCDYVWSCMLCRNAKQILKCTGIERGKKFTSCEYNGKTYKSGKKTINADSKCSKCTCTDGDFSCEKVQSKKCRRVCNKVRCKKTNCAKTEVDENLCCPKCVPDTAKSCDYKGLEYLDGETFGSVDGCNTCQCSNGSVTCSKRKCRSCVVDNVEYGSGESVPADDNCNNCVCRNGLVTCTKRLCRGCNYNGTEYKSGDKLASEDGCNSCVCVDGKVKCGKRECSYCEYDGQKYKNGQSFSAGDDCNKCFCSSGNVSCTNLSCPAGCNDTFGLRYKDGQVFTKSDGYNHCLCKNGTITCTSYECNGLNNMSCTVNEVEYENGVSFLGEDGCSKCTCFKAVVECLPLWCAGCKTEGGVYNEGEVVSVTPEKKCWCWHGKVVCKNGPFTDDLEF